MQLMLAALGEVMVHAIVPAGFGLPALPATSAVRVVLPPKLAPEEESAIVGVKLEILKLTLGEEAVR